MVHLLGLHPISEAIFEKQSKTLTAEQLKENSFPIHTDCSKRSDVLFLRPDLVSPAYKNTQSVTPNPIVALIPMIDPTTKPTSDSPETRPRSFIAIRLRSESIKYFPKG